ncbi:MAG: acyl-CoA dehydrogenase [Polyangiales bacterium]
MLGDAPPGLEALYRAVVGTEALCTTAAVAAALERLQTRDLLTLPLPGCGRTRERFDALSELGAIDLSLVRLAEGHVDAHAILAELGATPQPGCYGVWASESKEPVIATPADGGYVLQGRKRYASGASTLTRALVTARAPDGARLFDVPVRDPRVHVCAGSWHAVGMAGSDSLDVAFDGLFVPSSGATGAPNSYVERPSFWHGGVGVAACWYGGALGCAPLLRRSFAEREPDEHAAAHVGQVRLHCHSMSTLLRRAAAEIDADPQDSLGAARERALLVRSAVEHGCTMVLEHTHRALGPGPLVFDAEHARRAADLPVYVRQHHAERDLAELGRRALQSGSWP